MVRRQMMTGRRNSSASWIPAALLLVAGCGCLLGQTAPQAPPPPILASPAPALGRPISWTKLVPNIASDQKSIWLFPTTLRERRHWIPAATIVGVTAALVASDPSTAPYFRRTSSFSGFNRAFSGKNTSIGIVAAPLALYASGLIWKDAKMRSTALQIGEAIADAEILTTVFKGVDRRLRPSQVPLNGSFADTWFENRRQGFLSSGSFPSGHTIAAFSVATVIARRYGNHHWVPYVAYGAAALVAFSRVALSAHFISDVFMGGALGYSISRFVVLRQ